VTGGGVQTEGVGRFNEMPGEEARATLASCLAVPRWIDEVSAGRPYESAGAVLRQARSSAATRGLLKTTYSFATSVAR